MGEIGIHFGALADPISKQLNDQGFSLGEKDNERIQKIADAVTMLHLHDIIPESIVVKAHRKVLKLIVDAESIAEQELHP